MALKARYKYGGIAVSVVALLAGAKCAMDKGLIPKPASMAAKVPDKVTIPQGDVIAGAPAANYQLTAAPAPNLGYCPTVWTIPWMAAGALVYANGGEHTASDSLLKQYTGNCTNLARQDDYKNIQDAMLKFASGDHNAPAFGIIMGDGLPAFFAQLEPQMKKLKQDIVAVGLIGASYGEDACMGPDLHGNMQNMRGLTIAGYPADGDQDICFKLAGDNGIPVNVNNSTWDAKALNWTDANSFVDADNKYINNYCNDRDVVDGSKSLGQKKRVCVDGPATWTPGDYTVAKAKGGVVKWASTRQYTQQMPAVLIGNKQWMEQHREYVVGLLRAIDRGAFAIRTQDGVAKMATGFAEVFGKAGGDEADPNYWAKGFVGYDYVDKKGITVRIGGSRVMTLAETRDMLGMTPGSYNVYKGVVETFGKMQRDYYPDAVPKLYSFDDLFDTSYVKAALEGVNIAPSVNRQFTETKSIERQVSGKAYQIEFDTGKATIRSASVDELFDIANRSGMTSLRIQINGHTDNTGSPSTNIALSRARAQAVADWLIAQAPTTFPRGRFDVRGYGDTKPVADNATEAGRQKNRRVEVILGE
jgi:OOP family OmpA-OmpF porin